MQWYKHAIHHDTPWYKYYICTFSYFSLRSLTWRSCASCSKECTSLRHFVVFQTFTKTSSLSSLLPTPLSLRSGEAENETDIGLCEPFSDTHRSLMADWPPPKRSYMAVQSTSSPLLKEVFGVLSVVWPCDLRDGEGKGEYGGVSSSLFITTCPPYKRWRNKSKSLEEEKSIVITVFSELKITDCMSDGKLWGRHWEENIILNRELREARTSLLVLNDSWHTCKRGK